MKKVYISQGDLAKFCNCTQQYISKLKKKGLFDEILEKNKFPKDKSTELAKIIEDSKDPSRENQREANKKSKYGESDFSSQDEVVMSTSKEVRDSSLYNQNNLNELNLLLISARSSNQKVQIIKDFWTGKINEQKFLENESLLISKEQVIKDNQRILKAFRDKMLSLPTRMSGELIGLNDKKDIALVVESYVYELLEELSSLEDVV